MCLLLFHCVCSLLLVSPSGHFLVLCSFLQVPYPFSSACVPLSVSVVLSACIRSLWLCLLVDFCSAGLLTFVYVINVFAHLCLFHLLCSLLPVAFPVSTALCLLYVLHMCVSICVSFTLLCCSISSLRRLHACPVCLLALQKCVLVVGCCSGGLSACIYSCRCL